MSTDEGRMLLERIKNLEHRVACLEMEEREDFPYSDPNEYYAGIQRLVDRGVLVRVATGWKAIDKLPSGLGRAGANMGHVCLGYSKGDHLVRGLLEMAEMFKDG